MTIFAIIPARGSSKRIQKKNIKPFLGKPILTYPIRAALESGLFSEIMVSTDDNEIAEIAVKAGAAVPFLRSEKNSDDFATTADVVHEVIYDYQKHGKTFDIICVIYPTAVLTSAGDLQTAYQKFLTEDADAVLPVLKFSFPPQRGFTIKNNRVNIACPEHFLKRSQDLEPIYHDAGQYYFVRTDAFIRENSLIPQKTKAVIIPETIAQDIDTSEDWELAETKYKRRFIDS